MKKIEILAGELDNRVDGNVGGWLWFDVDSRPAQLSLRGDLHGECRGVLVRMLRKGIPTKIEGGSSRAKVSQHQSGEVVAMLGHDRYGRMYIEWDSESDGRVVAYLHQETLTVTATCGCRTWNVC